MKENSINPALLKMKEPILLLEDRKENQERLKKFCEKLGIRYNLAENGEIGLRMCEAGDFSIYIVDLMMPVMDGREFISELKKKRPDALILIQTVIDDPNTIIELMKMGIFDYIINE